MAQRIPCSRSPSKNVLKMFRKHPQILLNLIAGLVPCIARHHSSLSLTQPQADTKRLTNHVHESINSISKTFTLFLSKLASLKSAFQSVPAKERWVECRQERKQTHTETERLPKKQIQKGGRAGVQTDKNGNTVII
jgi:hypothetical protein